ncbi:MAG: ATP-binding protein, partial [Actinomycetota bacterium]
MVTCPSCGAENADGARFCSACGDGLEARSPAREERKVVSILFVDLVGFTASSDGADPEDVRDLLRAYHAAVKDRIEHYGGTVEKFVGDAVMAVFGAPVAHTDDAERAVRAGLRALEAVEELREARGEPTLAARAGVTTGEAVVTVDAGRAALDVVALGDVVNTAARLQTAAPPSRLLVAEETYRATREAIRYEPIPDVRAKGKADPVPAWLAVEPMAAPAERTIRATPLVGRERELSLLRSVWERATSEGNAHLVSVVGPPGIGKSRLSREFAAVVEGSGGRAIRGRSLPYDARDVYGAFAQQLRQLAGIFEQDPPEQARQKLARTVDALLPEAERQEMTRSLSLLLGLGIDQPVDDQILLFYAARRLVERLAAERPLLLVFEDVHWADAGQLDLIEYLAAHTRDAPVVFLALARPEFLDTRAGWGARLPGHTTVTLDPVSPDDAAAIVAALVGPEVPSHAVEPLVEVAEGNPLFLEELTAALLEGVQLGGRLPTTVRAAIAARVDALVPEQRAVLLTASVVGRAFWVGVLGALGVGDGVARVLDALEAKDLVRREPTSRVGGDVEFSFKHQLIRDVCYATLPRAERTTAHAAVARYIESVAGEQERELAWLLAHHWEGAGDRARSVEYLLVASDRAREALAADDAVALLDRALALTDGEEGKRRIRLRRARALTAFEDFDRAAGE